MKFFLIGISKLLMLLLCSNLVLSKPMDTNSSAHSRVQAKDSSKKADDPAEFQKLFQDWTRAFNDRNLTNTCQLFSKQVIANYQGVPEKDYHDICNGFKRIFAEEDRRYVYSFDIHRVYRKDNLAAVRITWFLKVFKENKLISETHDEGLDILKRNSEGQWQIIEYLGYGKEKMIASK